MECPKCHSDNETGAKFCNECRAKLEIASSRADKKHRHRGYWTGARPKPCGCTSPYQESDEFHILSVMDDGIGLKAGDSKDIFDIFKRTKTSRGIEGAGLGLAIVKAIAERHAGKIWMKPGTEKGIEFSVSISKNLQLSH